MVSGMRYGWLAPDDADSALYHGIMEISVEWFVWYGVLYQFSGVVIGSSVWHRMPHDGAGGCGWF